jgi:signal transduction histidine kinase
MQYSLLCRHFISHALDAIPVVLVVLNRRRQIVLANAQALEATRRDMDHILGKRPGEAFGCIHADQAPGGCGATEFCSKCGAIRSIIMGLEGVKNVQECNLLRRGLQGIEALDLQVSSSPIEIEEHQYTLFCIQDQSDLKRRRTLERLFFHDILNTVGGLRGLSGILCQEVPDRLKPDAEFINSTLAHLVDELQGQRDLLAAENNELTLAFAPLLSLEVLGVVAKMGASLGQTDAKSVRVLPQSRDVEFVSDNALVKRVLINMVKNALEASNPGESVQLSCSPAETEVVFQVSNSAVMEDDVRLRVFKRNFSTKGSGRGLGTYGMKLLSERYLEGEVSFTTGPPEGTVFTLRLPLLPERARVSGLGAPKRQ